ncbi:MAG: prevent-host-death family protein [Gammaproteobacteria bacterium]|nr:MAG: prevent-host-death family protein [Gammaproteobacteria bacterium]
MQTVNISDFRSNLLKYLNKAKAGEQISIKSNGKLLATISPPIQIKEQAKDELALLASTSTIGDVVSPLENEWELS